MAATKKPNSRKKTTKNTSGKSNRKTKTTTEQGVTSGFQTEIILLTILAASIILIISNLGMGGIVGDTISTVSFGIAGILAYIFPVFLFLGAVFLVSNRGSHLAYKKTLAAVVFILFLCGLIQLLTEGYMNSTTLADYYRSSSLYHTGGGVIGGAICISTISAFGVAGGYVIILLVLLIALILITQKSFFGFIFRIWDMLCELVRGGHELYMEGQPERDMRKELREQERRQRRELRRAERMKELEEAMTSESTGGFLEGTKLEPPVQQEGSESVQKLDTFHPENTATEAVDGEFCQKAVIEEPDMENAGTEEATERSESVIPEEALDYTVEAADMGRGRLEFKIQRSRPGTYMEAGLEQSDENDQTEEPETNVEKEAHEDVQEYIREEIQQDPSAERAEEPDYEELPEERLPSAEVKTEQTAPKEPAVSSGPVRNPKSSPQEIENGIQNIQKEITQQTEVVKKEYHFPPLKLLKRGDASSKGDSDGHLRKTAQKLQDTLHSFGVKATVVNASCGPTVTRYELQLEKGVKVSRITNLADDIKLNLATPDIRIEAPIPGKAAVGIEVPNKENQAVMLRDIIQSQEFQTAKSKLSFAVGKDIAGKPVVTDIAKMPHILIAGATGSGKSVCINTLIVSILYKASPEDVKLIMIDPKVVELSVYNGIPHLFIPVVTDPKKAAGALNWAVTEMMNRYNTFAEFSVRNLQEYNRKVENMRIPEGEERPPKLPQIVIIVDELADLMMVAPGEVEDAICRLAQLARAAGIHLIIATQRPSVNVITGLIKANMPSRVAFAVSSGTDSRTILDRNGAEKLLGKGDMLFYPQSYHEPARIQGAFVSDEEVSDIVAFLADKNPVTQYNTQIEQQVNTVTLAGGGDRGEERDVYFEEAGKFIIEKEKASIGMLQRMFKVGFNRAARIMDQLCDAGVVGPEEGTKPRKVLMTMEEFQNYIEEVL